MRDPNCIFCKIAAGEIPAATLYEDEDSEDITSVLCSTDVISFSYFFFPQMS